MTFEECMTKEHKALYDKEIKRREKIEEKLFSRIEAWGKAKSDFIANAGELPKCTFVPRPCWPGFDFYFGEPDYEWVDIYEWPFLQNKTWSVRGNSSGKNLVPKLSDAQLCALHLAIPQALKDALDCFLGKNLGSKAFPVIGFVSGDHAMTYLRRWYRHTSYEIAYRTNFLERGSSAELPTD